MPEHSFVQHRGYVAVGADLINGSMTIGTAQELCNSLSHCLSITMSLARTDGMLTSTKYLAFLKASATWDAEPTHLTLVKQRPLCARAAYRPMSAHGGAAPERLAPSTGSGPYCCEGHGCPSEDEYEPAELACEMPALSPRGVPRCSNLQGAPLPNLALAAAGASATISSAYPFAENAGAGAAIDGRLDGRYFHTRCDGSPQWFNLTFSSPISAEQIALHNRPLRTNDLLYRLVGSSVTLYGDRADSGEQGAAGEAGGGAGGVTGGVSTALLSLRVDSAREMYIWTLQPPVQRVRYLTVRLGDKVLPPGTACLHFSELEVFGTRQTDFDARGSGFSRRVPEPPPPVAAKPQPSRPRPTPRDASMDASTDASMDASGDASGQRDAARSGVSRDGPRPSGGSSGANTASPSQQPRASPGGPNPTHPASGGTPPGWLQAACAGSATAAVLLAMQALWVKSTWLDTWS